MVVNYDHSAESNISWSDCDDLSRPVSDCGTSDAAKRYGGCGLRWIGHQNGTRWSQECDTFLEPKRSSKRAATRRCDRLHRVSQHDAPQPECSADQYSPADGHRMCRHASSRRGNVLLHDSVSEREWGIKRSLHRSKCSNSRSCPGLQRLAHARMPHPAFSGNRENPPSAALNQGIAAVVWLE